MKLAIVPALAIAAGSVALMASPASATPEVRQAPAGPAYTAMTPDAKWYQHGEEDNKDVCYINQVFPGTNILSGQVLNDVVDAPIDVVVQVLTLLTSGSINSDKPIVNSCQ